MSYQEWLLALCIWREARGEEYKAKAGVAWSIRNRVARPGWWGNSLYTVILKPWQYSSFNAGDPNATKFPVPDDMYWLDCVRATAEPDDVSLGATHYYDRSLDGHPPEWAKSMTHTCNLGNLRFFK